MKTTFFAVVLGLVSSSLFAQAYTATYVPGGSTTPYTPPVYGSAEPYWSHSSTLEEGVFRGMGALTDAQGRYNLNTAYAMKLWQEARFAKIENDKRFVEAYFERRERNSELRARERGPIPTTEQRERWAKENAPERLTTTQIRTDNGELYWPAALQGDSTAEYRAIIGRYFQERAQLGMNQTTDSPEDIRSLAQAFENHLVGRVKEFETQDYLAARKFLTGLQTELRHSPFDASRTASTR